MKYGVLGGSFDPLHKEHIRLIEWCKNVGRLDKIILLPSYLSPHKKELTAPFDDRCAMLEAWAHDKEYIVVDRLEKSMELEKSYSYIINAELIKKYAGVDLVYIIGGDSMTKFEKWKYPEIIAAQMPIWVAAREGITGLNESIKNAEMRFGAEILKLDFLGKAVSSREIKGRLQLGRGVKKLLPTEVLQYLRNKPELYDLYGKEVRKLKREVTPQLFSHISRTVLFALAYSAERGLSYGEVFLAALLHDCAKQRELRPENYPTDSYKVCHQYEGARVAREEYGVSNAAVIDAIEYHTTGKPAMSELAKLIYCADKLEPERGFDGIDIIRESLKNDFTKGFKMLVARSVEYLSGLNKTIDKLTLECYNYYNN